MISVIEARDTVLNHVTVLGTERVDLFSALGRVLAEEVSATRTQPPWDNSAMDGYALRAEETVGASREQPRVFEIIEHLPAGYRAQRSVGPGQAIHIMTGAPLPAGADSIIRAEVTELLDPTHVRVLEAAKPGQDIRRAGEDMKKGDLLLPVGTVLRPAEIGLLASTNRTFAAVYRRPRVAILSTGDELVDVDEAVADGKIVDSNSYSLAALVMEAGGQPIRLGISKDTRAELEARLRDGLSADVILTSGGVSVGEYDYVKEALAGLGTAMEFWQVAMTPGRPLAFGRIQRTLVFGLPGNPVASMVTFELFVRPALLKMSGHCRLYRPTVRAILAEDLKKTPGRKQFIRVRLMEREGHYYASRTGAQGSGILRSMSLASGLAITHEHQALLRTGEEIEVMLLGGEWAQTATRNC